MAARIYSGRESPEFDLPEISDDVIQKLGEPKPLRYLKKPTRKFRVKRPVFETYLRMKTDKKFRKEYIYNNRITLRGKSKSFKKEKPKCHSVLENPIKLRLPPLLLPASPTLTPIYEPGGIRYHQKRNSEPVEDSNNQTFDGYEDVNEVFIHSPWRESRASKKGDRSFQGWGDEN